MKRHWQYLKYILRHKWYVFLAARSLGITWLGIVHDLSKFKTGEWRPYASTFYTSAGESQYDETTAFNLAWLHHLKRNKHHWQYWVLLNDSGSVEVMPMPDRYRREMLADWIGAGMALGKPDTLAWYTINRSNMQLHHDTRAWIELRLGWQPPVIYIAPDGTEVGTGRSLADALAAINTCPECGQVMPAGMSCAACFTIER